MLFNIKKIFIFKLGILIYLLISTRIF